MPSPTASEFDYVGPARPQLLTRTRPVDTSILASFGIDLTEAVTAEIQNGTELYSLVSGHLAKSGATKSFTIGIGSAKRGGCCGSDSDPDDCEHYRNTATDLGLGLFEKEYKGETVRILHQTLGDVVGTDCGATLLKSLVLIAPSISIITSFCDELIAEADQTSAFKFNVYRFHVQHQYWRRSETVEARPLESVVLPSEMKRKIVEDLDEFISLDSKKWYRAHGIPYKRSYLLHGSPGAGKTSLIQALAGRYKRNVCFLSPSHPDFTDDSLKAAVQRVPRDSIIVLEDIDGLGAAHRDPKKKEGEKSSLTFSGMLNALDGVGGQHGQIFVLTTNHRENLDPALIRNGRVDLHIEFTDATEEQIIGLFQSFYETADEALARSFASELLELLGDRTVSCAALQHYFITARKLSAEEAAKGASKVIEEMEAHGKYAKEGEKQKAEVVEADKEKKTPDGDDKGTNGESPKGKAATCEASGNGKVVHLHIH